MGTARVYACAVRGPELLGVQLLPARAVLQDGLCARRAEVLIGSPNLRTIPTKLTNTLRAVAGDIANICNILGDKSRNRARKTANISRKLAVGRLPGAFAAFGTNPTLSSSDRLQTMKEDQITGRRPRNMGKIRPHSVRSCWGRHESAKPPKLANAQASKRFQPGPGVVGSCRTVFAARGP